MCGIAGIYTKEDKPFEKDLKNMTNALKHRGPDSFGYHVDEKKGLYLGHRRLRIIDLSKRADQPMYSADKDIIIVFNGEIYNHLDIKKDLEKKGYKFKSSSDTEVIIYGYKEYGTKIFEKLDGVFGIGLWDESKRKLFVVRDRLGVIPLYYIYDSKTFYFASEVKAFKKVWDFKLNIESFKTLLGFMYNFHPKNTMVGDVYKVRPGTYLEITDKGIKEETYWNLKIKRNRILYKDAVEQTEKLLKEAVEKRVLNCDVPQGVLLSGGIDSSMVAALAAKVSGSEKVKTFTAISDSKRDEREHARTVANHIGSEHTEVYMDSKNILRSIDDIIDTYDDLNSVDPGVVSVWLLSDKIRKLGMRVVLTGEGADEVFGGYSWYGLSKFPFNLLPPFLRNIFYYYVLSRVTTNKFFSFHRKLFNRQVKSHRYEIYDQITSFEIKDQLPNHFNMKVNKGNMAHGVEPRVPYLDYKLVQFVCNLPPVFKLKGPVFNYWMSWEKRILRDVAKKYLPKEIFMRKKHGFMLSMVDTMNADIKYVRKRIKNNREVISSVLGEKYLNELFEDTGNKILATEKEFMTWKLFLFSVWYDKLIK
ncbi:asparagine synthase (glutamine-hydrolyzing) [Patescibacteria group bacterium]